MFRIYRENAFGSIFDGGDYGHCRVFGVGALSIRFQVVMTEYDSFEGRNYESYRVLMVDDVPMLERIIELQDESLIIDGIQVILPPKISGLKSWTMQQLDELRMDFGADGQFNEVYSVDGGQVYEINHSARSRSDILKKFSRVIYRCPQGRL